MGSNLQHGQGRKLWKYWTHGEGLARWISSPTPWTTLRAELLKEGVPAGQVDGLVTNIMLASPGGKALFEAHHKGKHKGRSDTMNVETRAAVITEVRDAAEAGTKPGFTARAVNYGVRDSYGTSWAPGVFRDSLERRMPPVVWGHDWNDPIGRVVGYREVERRDAQEPGGLEIDVELDDLDAVPRAKQAYAQLKSGTMSQFSFGFRRLQDSKDPALPNTVRIDKADVDEFSIVLNGAVPGTRPLAVRSTQDGTIEARSAEDLIRRLAGGEIDIDTALAALNDPQPGERAGALVEFRALTDGADPATALQALTDADAALAKVATELDKDDLTAARRFFSDAASRLSDLLFLLGRAPSTDWPDPYRGDKPAEERDEPREEQRAAEAEDAELLGALAKLARR